MSNKSSNEDPRVNKTPQQIMDELKAKEETIRQRKFVKEVLYPYLLINSKSVADAKMMLKATLIGLQQAFSNKVKEFQTNLSQESVAVLEMDQFVAKSKDSDRFKGLIGLLKEEKLAVTESLLDGMEQTITSFEREESTKRELSSLPAQLLD